jgi:18S rRNA (guanine1575-N7)-methyltransferase
MSRPEHIAPPDIFYNHEEAIRYASGSRIIEIQTKMSERALELLELPERPCVVLDLGCGSGLSGEVLSDRGHVWVGTDISTAMLGVALEREVDGDLFLADMGQGMCFRPGSFDAAISISALQWLCTASTSAQVPYKRLACFFQSLYNCLRRGARAVFQFYPEDARQLEMISSAAMRSGFGGGVLVDFPNSTKAKKYFLVLFAGVGNHTMPRALGAEHVKPKKSLKQVSVKGKAWVLHKKERMREQGKTVARDSKYTARRRKPRF